MLLDNGVAIVTGAGTGIGQEIARLFAAHGARVVLLDRNAEANRATAQELDPSGRRAVALPVDVRDRAAIDAAVERTIREWGRIDVLINNAGIYPRQEFLSMTEAQWDEMQDVNLKSMFHSQQAVLPHMIGCGHGKIVNISSVTFHLGVPNLTHYVASKGGVIGLTRSLAREFGKNNIHINCITPGAVLVEAEKAVVSDEQVQAFVAQQSLQRRILPIDIARTALFLACELSDGLTGQTLNVDGGWVMH
ncbi:MAG: SDR family NAD(P)-dependent oxidoreductase [Candidatus Sulfopaludibacter sp.]|nr:SDR family NAD(P)-dependent oxidoreductase [Candidatus Sulfopaludibacter sp.]